jgi:hypothetical protein
MGRETFVLFLIFFFFFHSSSSFPVQKKLRFRKSISQRWGMGFIGLAACTRLFSSHFPFPFSSSLTHLLGQHERWSAFGYNKNAISILEIEEANEAISKTIPGNRAGKERPQYIQDYVRRAKESLQLSEFIYGLLQSHAVPLPPRGNPYRSTSGVLQFFHHF